MNLELNKYLTWVPPGHHYSPIPDVIEIQEQKDSIFHLKEGLAGIVLDGHAQIQLIEKMLPSLNQFPFTESPKKGHRYYWKNPFFGAADGLILYALMKRIKPDTIIDIGTGFSTALMLDTNMNEFNMDINIHCIESFKGSISDQLRREKSLIIHDQDLYDIELSLFTSMKPNDILFVDSTHVSKTGSDVNYIIHEILPRLKAGVYVHFHDIMSNFEYPLEWIREGRAWNEAYIIRAFLMFNKVYQIDIFNSYLGQFHNEWLVREVPLFMKNTGGSLWIKKVK